MADGNTDTSTEPSQETAARVSLIDDINRISLQESGNRE